jgi:ribosomal protein S18 acetylase RimI-like enzyme
MVTATAKDGSGGAASPAWTLFEVRRLREPDIPACARLHQAVLGVEFVARAGEKFLRRYQRAWCKSPAGLALVAVSASGEVLGAVLGALRPAEHYRYMARRHGIGLALSLLGHAVLDHRFARELVATRAARYLRGAVRVLGGPVVQDRGEPAVKEGEVTHLMVDPSARGMGIGRALLEGAISAAEEAGLDQLVLVTPLGEGPGSFYLHLGWQPFGEVTSRSGERFTRYRLALPRGSVLPRGGALGQEPLLDSESGTL